MQTPWPWCSAGANRIGASAGIKIVDQARAAEAILTSQ